MHARALFSFVVLLLSGCATVPIADASAPSVESAAEATPAELRLAAGLRLETISFDGRPGSSGPAFIQLREVLARAFPVTHRTLRREVVGEFSLLFTWVGTEPEAPALLLSAHQDVVPIEEATLAQWHHAPFSGDIAEGFIWGRGTWDDKGNLFAMMEAVEQLATAGFQPRQTIYLAFGHDEEMGTGAGQRGAQAIAALLRDRGARLEFVLDEGLVVVDGAMEGLAAPVALIGVAEKGYLTLGLSTNVPSGHASSPPGRGAILLLSEALVLLEKNPMPAAIQGVARQMFEALAPSFTGANRFFLSNLWLFEAVVRDKLVRIPSANAMLRTTAAFTVIFAGEKENTLPGHAEARINFRLLPGDSAGEVLTHVKRVLAGSQVTIETSGPYWEASSISDSRAAGYERIARAVNTVFPDAVVGPGLMIGATDSRAYAELAAQTYRFSPLRVRTADLARLHGVDERISRAGYVEMVDFYRQLLSP